MSSYVIEKQSVYLTERASLFMFHIDSLTSDRSKNIWNNKNNILSYDLSYLSTIKIQKLIKALNIDVFVFYSFQSHMDKLIWSICQLLNIPTILQDHGIVFGNKIASLSKPYFSLPRFRRKLYFSIKLLQLKCLEIYFNEKLNSKTKYEFDHYLLYSTNNLDFYRNIFFLNEFNTTICGIPLFDNEKELNLLKGIRKENKMLYIHQPFIKFGFSSLTIQEEINYINDINSIAERNNYILEIRLHPSSTIDTYKDYAWNSNIHFNNKSSLEIQSASAFLIIGHWSTALAIAYPLSIPLIVLEYPKIEDEFKQYQAIFRNVSYYCETLTEFENVLAALRISDNNEIKQLNWERLIGTHYTVENECKNLLLIIESTTSE